MNNSAAIEVLGLKKSFGENHAVQGVSFNVNQGEIFSLLGPNGAGKTTTISMLSCLLRPNDGDANIMGHSISTDPMGVKSVLGVVPQDLALYEDLTARENLSFWGKMYGLRGSTLKTRVDEVLNVIGLRDRANERVGKYSGGMKRRVNIGVALLHKPKVIYMDEPTVGIDPQSRRNILDSVVLLKNEGMTVLYTTHYMEEAQELSDHIGIMDHGKLIAHGTHDELVKMVGQQTRIDLTLNGNADQVMAAWKETEGVSRVTSDESLISVLVQDSNLTLPHLFEAATKHSARITSVNISEPNLEAVFLHLTGRALRD
ncbi:ATP-binding cassette domain-containing protein [Candidatus Villigracilis affinis]|jgi:ABC-2 type transport system ATP-binding protein|uniref:ABC transporter ATP-binding protein n=1 Tax=Candidatus Villigracilis affinis TaxID=3140682 RepID=UPI001B529E40|nr:ATP-binding cassette domain-containing protein [Anaerolineales bacterium]MBL0344779.1 ATP-binding cassette domain-containing protein [Anaerolineales bacterium]MBP8047494.1 ATP-binding cassette domain-containing protein [Anaerolineales bacterium]